MLFFAQATTVLRCFWNCIYRRESSSTKDRLKNMCLSDNEALKSLSEERIFLENLVQQRFNFLLVVYSLVIAGATNTPFQTKFKWVLTAGTLLCWGLAMTISRVTQKLEIALCVLHDVKGHGVYLTSDGVNNPLFGLTSVSLIGRWIPAFCTISLLSATLCGWIGWLPASESPHPVAINPNILISLNKPITQQEDKIVVLQREVKVLQTRLAVSTYASRPLENLITRRAVSKKRPVARWGHRLRRSGRT